MTTMHETVAESLLQAIVRDSDTHAALLATRGALATGEINAEQVAVVGQKLRAPADWEMPQLAALMRVQAGIATGEYVRTAYNVGAEPGPDADRHGNAHKLRALSTGSLACSVDLQQHGSDRDGTVTWNTNLSVLKAVGAVYYDEHNTPQPLTRLTQIPAFTVPLEIGYTQPSRTYLHLEQDGGLARWPYGQRFLSVLVRRSHPLVRRST